MSFSNKQQGKKEMPSGQQQNKNRGQSNNYNQKKWNNNATRHAASTPPMNNGEIAQDAATAKVMHDRMLYLLGNLTGLHVEVTVKDGCKFKGIFHGASTEGDLGIALKFAQKIFDPSSSPSNEPIKNTLLIFSKDLVEINASNVDLSPPVEHTRNTFKTDTDISGKLDFKERELHKWAPEDDGENALGLLSSSADAAGSWDQFAANEKLFGLKTDFDEELYTTTLNRSAPGYKDREKRAIKMANEIQKTSTTNVHLMEERGMTVDDSGMDEEDLYGAVVREEQPSNKYIPPALRNKQSFAKKTTTSISKLITSDLPKVTSNPSPIANLPTTRRDSSNNTNTSSVIPNKRIETEIATTFKHFAMMEKDKLHAKKQALQKKEKDGRLAELKAFHQSFKLNVPIPADLFPLLSKGNNKKAVDTGTGPVVDDKKKTSPPVTTSTTATTNVAPSVATTTTATTTATPPPAAKAQAESPKISSPAPSATSPATTNSPSGFKFNVKASSFKPNPTATAFVPSASPKPSTNKATNVHLTMTEAFAPPPLHEHASHVGPTWPFGNKSYRVQFMYEEQQQVPDMMFNYGFYPPPPPQAYRYYPGPPPQMMPGPPPQQQSSPHGSPYQQQRMVPVGYHPYPPPPPPMMRYPLEMMQQMRPQGEMYGSPHMQHYPPPQQQQQHPDSGNESGTETPPPPSTTPQLTT